MLSGSLDIYRKVNKVLSPDPSETEVERMMQRYEGRLDEAQEKDSKVSRGHENIQEGRV